MYNLKFWISILSALGSIGTFISFIILLFDKYKKYRKTKNKKKQALERLKYLKSELKYLLKDISQKNLAKALTKGNVSEQFNLIKLDISEILIYKLIGYDIIGNLSTLQYKISNITKNIANNHLKQSEIDRLETTLYLLEENIDLAIKRLEQN